MYAICTRGVLCATALVLFLCPARALSQAPTPTTSAAVARIVAEHALVQNRLAEAGGTMAAGKAELGAAAPKVARSLEPLKATLARLPAIRPGATRSFLARQLEFPRVRSAYQTRGKSVSVLFAELGVTAPEVFFRVFKKEQVLEVWTRNRGRGAFELLRTYPVCKLSGRLGPKRRQGDYQIPEGFYEIDLLNPWSEYHLSMRVDYPNPVDRARGAGHRLGGDIYIHGGCVTIGCVPVTDRWIEEIYLIVINARDAGQHAIPVHIFPTRLDRAGMRWLAGTYGPGFIDYPFWQNLQEGYMAFEGSRLVPTVSHHGARYRFTPATPPADRSTVAADLQP